MSTQTTSAQTITAEISISAPAAQLYHLVSTRSGWIDWFAEKGVGSVEPSGILQLYHYKIERLAFVFHEFVPDERVRFTTLDPKTLETSEVEVLLWSEEEQMTVKVTQSGLAEERQQSWQNIWDESLSSLKAIFETGKDPRMWNRPFLGVTVEGWVSPEYAVDHQLDVEFGMHLNSVFEGKGAEQAGIQGGDVIQNMAGVDIVNFESLLLVYKDHQAGDTIPVVYVHQGERCESQLTLSAYPVPEVPATTQDLADNLAAFFAKANQKINHLLAGQTDAQTSYRPAAGEWSAKEVIAHLIAAENDSVAWLGSYLAGRESYPYTSALPARIKMITAVYPTMDALLEKLNQAQQELVALVREVPADVAGRKTSMIRLAFAYSFDNSLHYREHLAQLKDALELAADVRPS
ncbi:MAG: DinB family protein [Anaerolineales bacterium]|nr:DinB family protein [Anaerolineales bacterium]